MNATETIFALALASNCQPQQHLRTAYAQLCLLGEVEFSPIYKIPCRDGVGADYWNSACLLKTAMSLDELTHALKQMEVASGRVRPSHQISLDVDLIAWGNQLDQMQWNPKKIPLALDVKIPLWDVWQNPYLHHAAHHFPTV